ncbi:FYVE zinc finger domain and Zinc finger, FYVE/PHD-type domain and Zinc finger, RING/FYVE/PHD-type domain and Zinc finger, FYVE-related domain-containing protein [Strongyloides ratti]|uniref:FYVE zinc finger domain and Zinc finger, FYVE/PHD-type domain and Zinc finger, RING/FYVE/PHD-type domain and Zinc finger, FYVE-related domain-containing protein n=1 Tax=Strongyloides ratti TaxID=34506 RepID=A0A090MWG2_STRRB|nr:FYVE zinc finger domain and Zinc finger, FYVE/PHD-type domain and Zinc finger, RING/FYVE/PHD-type domain and Zinc finger, FYVE-related domain-containing protein [Strongyloides ratti]CEF63699.1 FYVE zinc finger domain and Zinc finger, FYVE/PHD-type domain and Zinc finger, RING/FYVE/PHD-type domain and Zinc finger, FYVE-related domain-containing protein [Strongyloides ratti]
MACTGCMQPFSLFRKEHGCSNCAFGFCEKCLNKKIVIAKFSPKPVSVCGPCFEKLSKKENNMNAIVEISDIQPINSKKRTDSSKLLNEEKWWGDDVLPPPSFRQQYSKPNVIQEKYINKTIEKSTKIDKGIQEIEERLAKLKNVDVEIIRNPRLMVTNEGFEPDEDDSINVEAILNELKQENKYHDNKSDENILKKNLPQTGTCSSSFFNNELKNLEENIKNDTEEAEKIYNMAENELNKYKEDMNNDEAKLVVQNDDVKNKNEGSKMNNIIKFFFKNKSFFQKIQILMWII